MSETRRGFLSLLGLSPLAAKGAAASITAKSEGLPPPAPMPVKAEGLLALSTTQGLMICSTAVSLSPQADRVVLPPKKIV